MTSYVLKCAQGKMIWRGKIKEASIKPTFETYSYVRSNFFRYSLLKTGITRGKGWQKLTSSTLHQHFYSIQLESKRQCCHLIAQSMIKVPSIFLGNLVMKRISFFLFRGLQTGKNPWTLTNKKKVLKSNVLQNLGRLLIVTGLHVWLFTKQSCQYYINFL